jgi:hypothetical protein
MKCGAVKKIEVDGKSSDGCGIEAQMLLKVNLSSVSEVRQDRSSGLCAAADKA